MSGIPINTILETIKSLTTGLSPEEKAELLEELPIILGLSNPEAKNASGQQQSNAVSGVTMSGGDNAFNFNPQQIGQGNAVSSQTITKTISDSDLEQILVLLVQLHHSIEKNSELKPSEKDSAKAKVEQLKQELSQEEPDKSVIGQTLKTLKQSFEGIITLAEPVTKVATLLGTAWALPLL
jgi:hypothetical protein